MNFAPIFFVLCAFLLQLLHVTALDLDFAREKKCFEPETVSMSLAWVLSHKRYYYPYLSRNDLYHACVESSGRDVGNVTEIECIQQGCYVTDIVRGWLGVSLEWHAFGVRNVKELSLSPVSGLEKYDFLSETGNYGGTTYSVMTDSETYFLVFNCIHGDMTWTVASPYKSLPDETLDLVKKKIVEYGFSTDHFMAFDFENSCDIDSWPRREEKAEL